MIPLFIITIITFVVFEHRVFFDKIHCTWLALISYKKTGFGVKLQYSDSRYSMLMCVFSMFIELKGRSKEEAFRIGYEICDAVTAMNPKPMKLKFEKVYLPCILQTKKRYVGFSYETPEQKEPIFDAKGIETVRRDACPAVAKVTSLPINSCGSLDGADHHMTVCFSQCFN